MKLSTGNHDRDAAGMTYVYPVVSRRAQGVSVGVNLNPNNACNWRCVYCQVPGLVAGKGPAIDLGVLRQELHDMLFRILRGDYLERHVPEGSRRLNDVALSGNGEPTGSPDFVAALRTVGEVLEGFSLRGELRVIVISNGSLAHKPEVREGLEVLSDLGGELWFKLDRATEAGAREVNSSALPPDRVRANLRAAAARVPTWIQTCLFARNGEAPEPAEIDAYLAFLAEEQQAGTPLEGVLLYGLARASHQPEAPELSPLPAAFLESVAERLRALGLTTRVHL